MRRPRNSTNWPWQRPPNLRSRVFATSEPPRVSQAPMARRAQRLGVLTLRAFRGGFGEQRHHPRDAAARSPTRLVGHQEAGTNAALTAVNGGIEQDVERNGLHRR